MSSAMQVKKDEADLAVGWGEGPKFNLPKRGPQLVAGKDGEKEVGEGQLWGKCCSIACQQCCSIPCSIVSVAWQLVCWVACVGWR